MIWKYYMKIWGQWHIKSADDRWPVNHNQSSMAKQLGRWANLAETPPLSDWEIVGSNPTVGMSRLGFLSWEEIPMIFPDWQTENVSNQFSTQLDHLVAWL